MFDQIKKTIRESFLRDLEENEKNKFKELYLHFLEAREELEKEFSEIILDFFQNHKFLFLVIFPLMFIGNIIVLTSTILELTILLPICFLTIFAKKRK